MPSTTFYSTGTVTVANGGTTVTGVGTAWIGKIYAGDLFTDPAQGLVARVTADAVSDTSLSINPWPGTALSADPYEILITPDTTRVQERTRQLLEALLSASNVGFAPPSGMTADDVQAAIEELFGRDAADIVFAPTGSLAATTVQTAIAELDTEKQPLDADLTALASAFTAASSSGPAQLALAEDADNGTSKITVKAPAALAADRTATLPDATGTLLVGALGSTDNVLLRSDGTGGATAQGSAITVNDSGDFTSPGVATIGSATLLAGRTFTLDGQSAVGGQPALAFNASGHTANKRVLGIIFDGQSALSKPGLVFQDLSDTGAFVNNTLTIWRDGGITMGGIAAAGVGDLYMAAGNFRIGAGNLSRTVPVTKTADFNVAAGENWLINNKAGSACTVTLPSAASFPGREIMIKTTQAQATNSASSNVVPLAGGPAGTAILSANAGRWATLVSDGANWVIMAGVI